MCVRPACYLPSHDDTPSDHAAWLVARRNLATLAEIAALGAFLYALLIWSSVLSPA